MERLYNWLLLKAIRGLGEVSIKRLWLAFGSAEDILSASYEDLKEMVGEERARAIKRRELSFEPEEVIRLVEREGIGWVCLEDEAYPTSLREIEDPAPVLFYRGEIRQVPMIGIVGTRKPDSQSLGFIKSLVREVVSKGYGVCSGGAIGCDFYSHKECLALGGYTVCLLGMGILKIPAYLSKLQNGNMLFLSEFLPEASPEEYTFPRRNRLISGLSKALVVAEAGQKSGSLITAQYAIKQKKPLWVYVGNALSQRWLGCINLVNEGKAKVLYSPTLLFQELPSSDSLKDPLLDLLTTPKTFDELLEITRLSHQELTMRLTQLELEGKVLRNGSYYMSL
ncbi:MAG: DNA-processing protein DprA [Aquificota bacterium]|nr:MAG: DNA-processing protein DprA [Aquificota bacterium]